MAINVTDLAGVTHSLKWEDVTKCGRRLLWREHWVGTQQAVDCMTCLVSKEPGFYGDS